MVKLFLLYLGNVTIEKPERTLIIVKPDGVQRRLIGKIIERFESKGFKLMALKLIKVSGK